MDIVPSLKGPNRAEHCDANDLERIVIDFFNSVFAASNPSNIETILDTIPTKVIESMNESLNKRCTIEEVKHALDQI